MLTCLTVNDTREVQLEINHNELLLNELLRDEGFVPHAYTDSLGFTTIGIGRLIDKRRGGGITKDEALYLLANDVDKVVNQLNTSIPWWTSLSPTRRRVLVNMGFNLGVPGLLKFKNTLTLIKEGKYELAANAMLKSLWAKQVGARANRLADLMRKGTD